MEDFHGEYTTRNLVNYHHCPVNVFMLSPWNDSSIMFWMVPQPCVVTYKGCDIICYADSNMKKIWRKTNKNYYYVIAVKEISNRYMVPCNTPWYEPSWDIETK